MKQLTVKKLKAMIAEEKKSAKEYREYGLDNIAKDEKNHAYMLEDLLDRFKTAKRLGVD